MCMFGKPLTSVFQNIKIIWYIYTYICMKIELSNTAWKSKQYFKNWRVTSNTRITSNKQNEMISIPNLRAFIKILIKEFETVTEKRLFKAVKLFHIILRWLIFVIIHLSTALKWTASRVNLRWMMDIWVIMTCQCRFMDCSQCSFLRGCCVCLGKRECSSCPYFLLHFTVSLKLIREIKSILKVYIQWNISYKAEWNNALCSCMDRSRDDHIE